LKKRGKEMFRVNFKWVLLSLGIATLLCKTLDFDQERGPQSVEVASLWHDNLPVGSRANTSDRPEPGMIQENGITAIKKGEDSESISYQIRYLNHCGERQDFEVRLVKGETEEKKTLSIGVHDSAGNLREYRSITLPIPAES
jgi:hypothetical protein